MKKIFISVLLFCAASLNAYSTDHIVKSDSVKVLKFAAMEKADSDFGRDKEVKPKAPAAPVKEEPKLNNRPTFTGGEKAIRDFVRVNMRYPKECEAERLIGRVTITMTINPDGTPANIKIARSSGNKAMDAEALRIANLMPKWQPAEEKENAVAIQYTLPIQFRPGR